VNPKKPNQNDSERHYPAVYEKTIPIMIGLLVLLIAGMLVLTIGIATGWISAG